MVQKIKSKKIIIPIIASLALIILNSPTLTLYSKISPQVTLLPTVTLTFYFPSYAIYVNPLSFVIEQGGQAQAMVTISSFFGYNKSVTLYTSNVPSGILISFAISKLTPPANGNVSTTAFISVSKTVAPGTYKMFINATDGSMVRGTLIQIEVTAVTTSTPTTSPTTTSPTTTTPTTTTPTTTPTTTYTSPTTTPITTTSPPTTTTSTPTTTTFTTPTTTTSTITSTPTTSTTQSGGIDTTTIIIIAIILIAVFAAIAFFLLRKKPPPPPPPAKRYCMHCGSGMPEDAISCPKCGKQPAGGPDTKVCPNCGSVINIVAAFCPKCGAAQPKAGEKSGAAGG